MYMYFTSSIITTHLPYEQTNVACMPSPHRNLIMFPFEISFSVLLRLASYMTFGTTVYQIRMVLSCSVVCRQVRGCLSPCGRWMLAGGEDGALWAWDCDTGEDSTRSCMRFTIFVDKRNGYYFFTS